jgi:uncharacterized protein YecE (DUF72 family)
MRPEGKRRVYLRHLEVSAVDEIWSRFRSALEPLKEAGNLGAVLFQFPPWFTIKRANKDYVAECAERWPTKTVHAVFRNVHRDFAPRSAERLRDLLPKTVVK